MFLTFKGYSNYLIQSFAHLIFVFTLTSYILTLMSLNGIWLDSNYAALIVYYLHVLSMTS